MKDSLVVGGKILEGMAIGGGMVYLGRKVGVFGCVGFGAGLLIARSVAGDYSLECEGGSIFCRGVSAFVNYGMHGIYAVICGKVFAPNSSWYSFGGMAAMFVLCNVALEVGAFKYVDDLMFCLENRYGNMSMKECMEFVRM